MAGSFQGEKLVRTLDELSMLPIPTEGFVTFHFDEIADCQYRPETPLELVQPVMTSLVDLRRKRDGGGLVRLAVILRESDAIDLQAPERDTLLADVHPMEPPSVYIFEDPYRSYRPFAEEYRLPLQWNLLEIDEPRPVTYYACFRSIEHREHDWGFTRVLWTDLLLQTDLAARHMNDGTR